MWTADIQMKWWSHLHYLLPCNCFFFLVCYFAWTSFIRVYANCNNKNIFGFIALTFSVSFMVFIFLCMYFKENSLWQSKIVHWWIVQYFFVWILFIQHFFRDSSDGTRSQSIFSPKNAFGLRGDVLRLILRNEVIVKFYVRKVLVCIKGMYLEEVLLERGWDCVPAFTCFRLIPSMLAFW